MADASGAAAELAQRLWQSDSSRSDRHSIAPEPSPDVDGLNDLIHQIAEQARTSGTGRYRKIGAPGAVLDADDLADDGDADSEDETSDDTLTPPRRHRRAVVRAARRVPRWWSRSLRNSTARSGVARDMLPVLCGRCAITSNPISGQTRRHVVRRLLAVGVASHRCCGIAEADGTA